jgi:F-type H+-transporting ATPase subunit b
MKKNIVFVLTLFTGVMTLAAEVVEHTAGGHHEEIVIPLREIGWQAANLGILVIALFFFLRKSIAESFAKRRSNFIAQAEKTKEALKLAEAELADTKAKLANLENGEAKALENAKHEAMLISANMIKDSEAQAAKMKADAEMTIRNELMKAKMEINAIILGEAVAQAKSKISAGAAGNVQNTEAHFLAQVEDSKSKASH